MFKETDFAITGDEFRFKKDSYPIKKIHDVRIKHLSIIDNLGQILFWVALFSGALWLAIPNIETAPLWWKILVACMTVIGLIFALFRCSKFALQIEFKHIDETGLQWINVAKSNSKKELVLFEKQVKELKAKSI